MLKLDERSGEPKYKRLMEKIVDLIWSEVLKPNQKMPSIRALSKEIMISPNTVQKSYHLLEKYGYLYSEKSKGYYVASLDKFKIEQGIEDKLKPKFFQLLRKAKYLGLSRDEIEKWLGEVEWD